MSFFKYTADCWCRDADCSQITANLVLHKSGVRTEVVQVLPLDQEVDVCGVPRTPGWRVGWLDVCVRLGCARSDICAA